MKSFTKCVLIGIAVIFCAVLALKGSALLISSGTWQATGNLSVARAGASAALLPDGRILITGGDPGDGTGPQRSADLFNTDGTISAAALPMANARSGHISVTLQNGKVLVAGGTTAGGSTTSTAEFFDPAAGSWSAAGVGMIEARSGATAALLSDGRVLIAGGQNGSTISSTIEIFNPALGVFTSAGMMSSPRTQHAMTVLQDGRVLIVGGNNGTAPVASTDIFDPVAGTVTAGPILNTARFGHSATTLLNGLVVVIGGNNGNANPAQVDATPAEMVDFTAATPAFTILATNLATPREGHLAVRLPNNNNILIAGGTSAGTTIASAELFTPQESPQGVWTYGFGATGTMTTARSAAAGSANQVNATSTTMQRNGVVMVAGGNDVSGINTTEAYGYPTVQTDQDDYPPGTLVTITGSGFKPLEPITIQLVESPMIDTHGPYTVQADANGNFTDTSFTTDLHDVNIRFYLTATGGTSGFQAQNTFTDAVKDYEATISPTTDTAGHASTGYTVTITNDPASTGSNISQATIMVPSGYTSVVLGTVTTSPSGLNWTASIASGVITLTANTGPDHITAGQSLSLALTATAPCTDTTYTWTTSTSGNFTLLGTQPTVTVTGTCTTTNLGVSLPASTTAGTPFSFTVTALTASNAVATNYRGTVHFTSSDAQAVLPADYTFTGTDAGTHTFTGTTLKTSGTQSITATDKITSTITGVGSTSVSPAPAKALTVSAPTTATAGTAFNFTVTAKDAFGNVATGYTGTVKFTSTDAQAVLPANSALTNGTGTFSATLKTAGTQTITATDTVTSSITGTSGNITVSARATSTSVSCSPSSESVGAATTCTATVKDTDSGTTSTPTGSVSFTSSGSGSFSSSASCNLSGSGTTASCNLTYTPSAVGTGTANISGSYGGDTTHATSSGAFGLTVTSGATTTSVTSSQNPSTYGQSVTFTATVTPSSGSVNPTGTVTFTDTTTSTTLCSAVGVSNGTGATSTATCSTSTLTVDGGVAQTITATYNATGSFTGSSGTVSGGQMVNQATPTATLAVSNSPQTYNGSGQAAMVTISTSSVAGAVANILTGGAPTQTAAGTYAVTANFVPTDTTDYKTLTGLSAGSFVISQASSTTVVMGGSFTYDGNPHAAAVSVTGVGGLSLTPAPTYSGSCSAVPITVAQGTSCLASYTYTGDADHTGSSSSAAVTITAATPGLPATQTGTSTYGTSVTLTVKITASGSGETPTGSVQFQFTNGGVTYNICSDGTLQAQQPPPGTPCVVTLDDTGTATVTTTKLPAGMTADAITATYKPGDSNYTGGTTSINYTVSMASTMATLNITPATAPTYGDTVTLSSAVSDSTTDSTGTPTGTVQFEYSTDGGNNWINIGAAVTLDDTGNAQTTTTNLPAGTPQVKAVYSGDTNFTGSSSGATVYPVNQKVLTVTGITASSRPYDGLTDATLDTSHEMLVGVVNSDSVTLSGTATGAFTPDGNVGNSKTVQISGLTLTGGAAAANYTLTQPSATASITAVQLTVTAPSPTVTYGDPVPTLTPHITGFVNGEDSGVLTTQPTCMTTYTPSSNAGSAQTTSCSGAVATNYTFTYTPGTVTVNQAPSTTVVTFEAGPYTYRGTAFTATATVTGVGGLNAAVTPVVYTGDCTNVSANGCTATATFTGDTNHTSSMDHKSITITQAPSTTVVTFEAGPYNYRATAFTATAVVTGVGGLSQAVSVVYSGDCLNVTSANGCTATATFAGDTNHTSSMDHKSITITQASSTTTVAFESAPYTYRGTAFTATATVTGVGGLNQAVSVVYTGDCVNVSVSGCTATATFAGDNNHTGSNDSKSITITQAPSATVVACPTSVTYNGSAQMPCSASVTGAALSQILIVGYVNNTNAGTATASASYPGDTNHSMSSSSANFTITPASTSTLVISSPNPSNWGNVVTLTATVKPAALIPTGSVSFYNAVGGASCSSLQMSLGSSTLLDTVQLTTIDGSQQASTSAPNLPVGPGNTVGSDTILACYNYYDSADPKFNPNFTVSNGTTTQTVYPAPIATLVPSSLSFGGQQGGTVSGPQIVYVCNGPGSNCPGAPGSTAALLITGIGFTNPNTNPAYFTQTSTCPIGGNGLPVGGYCTISVSFAPPPNTQGIATALLTVTDNNENVSGSTQSASLVGAGTSAVMGVGSLSTYAIFGTANGCSSVNVSGNGTVDSFGGSTTSGNIGTNGNVTLSGNPVVSGAVYSPVGGTGSCSARTMTGLSTSGKAQATGGLQALTGPVNYPLPSVPNPPTTTQNISGSCGSIGGCSNNGSKNVILAPGQYGNLNISGGTIVNVSGGTYNINSLTLSGNSSLVVTPNTGPVVVNLAGKSLSGGNAALDLSGGSMSNSSGMASNLQFYYAGSQPVKLSGGTGSYAVVYAPNAPINVSGGSHFYGSIVGGTVNSSGNTAIHYPTTLPSLSSPESIWFSSSGLTVKGLPNTGSVKLYVTNATINFMANGTTYNLPVPNAVITFSSTATSASTTWDATNNRWSTIVPTSSVNNVASIHTFFDGVAYQVPSGGFPTGIQNVTWQAAYSTSQTGLSFNWQWGAAVYSSLPNNYSSLTVNPIDNNPLYGSDPAGTPENYRSNLVFGDLGAGYTGLYANFVGVVPTIAPMNVAPSSYDFGVVAVSTPTTASVPFVLTNNDSVSYTISGIQMTGTYAGDFGQTNTCGALPVTLPGGGSCTFTVTFTPSASSGTKETAKIVINDNANNSPQTVFLKGTVQ